MHVWIATPIMNSNDMGKGAFGYLVTYKITTWKLSYSVTWLLSYVKGERKKNHVTWTLCYMLFSYMLLATQIFNRYKEEKLTYYLEKKNYLILYGYLDIWLTRANGLQRDETFILLELVGTMTTNKVATTTNKIYP